MKFNILKEDEKSQARVAEIQILSYKKQYNFWQNRENSF